MLDKHLDIPHSSVAGLVRPVIKEPFNEMLDRGVFSESETPAPTCCMEMAVLAPLTGYMRIYIPITSITSITSLRAMGSIYSSSRSDGKNGSDGSDGSDGTDGTDGIPIQITSLFCLGCVQK